jgi:nicotinamide-nucleotide amidase
MVLDKEIADTIGEELKRINSSVAVAESVTGGFLQAAFTIAKEASTFFQGGITAYNVGQKYRHLLIEPLHALSCNSVSLKIAENMAKHVCDMFGSAYGIATTGYAAPMPEKNINRLFTYYAISKESTILFSGEIESKENEGMDTQIFYANEIMKKFLEILKTE